MLVEISVQQLLLVLAPPMAPGVIGRQTTVKEEVTLIYYRFTALIMFIFGDKERKIRVP